MKTILFFALVISVSLSTQILDNKESRRISGKVVDQDGKAVIAADVFVNDSRKGGLTDSLGEFELIIPSKVEFLIISKSTYKNHKVTLNSNSSYYVELEEGINSNAISRNSAAKSETLRLRGMPSMKRKEAPMSEGIPIKSTSMDRASFAVEDVSFTESPASYPSEEAEGGIESEFRKSNQNTSAGQLTAGEWNDLNNWEAWKDLIENKDYSEMEAYWEIDASERISVFVSNQYELPIADCLVTLKSGNKIIWTSKTDNSGRAEMWIGKDSKDLEIFVESKENKHVIRNVKRIKQGVNHIQFKEECGAPQTAEIMFVVDATGSMGDEIDFLKSELSDVIDQVESNRSSVSFRWGSVFYRDKSDTYLSRQSPLNSKTKKVLDFIKMQSAGGGGDYPEAVNEGLEEALMQDWSSDAIARIIFLVLDAPPHHDQEVLQDLESQIEFASAMGIKIIPITASGINRQTEYLMKFMSIMTNGTYVFLTDHSGIGNAHLAPVVKDYEVEKLNELLIRVIGNYTDPGTCVQQSEKEDLFAEINVYPNPTIDQVRFMVPNGVEKVTLTSSSGMLIKTEKNLNYEDVVTVDLSTYVDGMYMLNFFADDEVYSIKVIKSNRV